MMSASKKTLCFCCMFFGFLFYGVSFCYGASSFSELKPVLIPGYSTINSVDLDEVYAVYRRGLTSKSEDIRYKSMIKLADISFRKNEDKLFSGGELSVFEETVSLYREILIEFPGLNKSDYIYYQLARAFELSDQRELSVGALLRLTEDYPGSVYLLESEFRLGEHYFSQEDYVSAVKYYHDVILRNSDSIYHNKALYMYAWALYKFERYSESAIAFYDFIGLLVPAEGLTSDLDRGNKELLDDCVRVLSVIFSETGGVNAINYLSSARGGRYYDGYLYNALAKHYIKHERFVDGANAYKYFVEKNPYSEFSYQFQSKVVNVFKMAGFSLEVLREKKRFVDLYYPGGDYFSRQTLGVQLRIERSLKFFLMDISSYYHSRAQADYVTAKGKVALVDPVVSDYVLAKKYYELFINAFPNDDNVPNQTFLLGEVQYALQDYANAIASYERVAYRLPKNTEKLMAQAAESAYAAILAYNKLHQTIKKTVSNKPSNVPDIDVQLQSLMQVQINSELDFSGLYNQDLRAAEVLLDAAQKMLELKDYSRAIVSARRASQWQPALTPSRQISAWLIIGQASFDIKDYAAARVAYKQVLGLLDRNAQQYSSIAERYAASIYQQGEEASLAGNKHEAIKHYLSVVEGVAASSIRINAQFDAAVLYVSLLDYDKAIPLLQDFRQRYPANTLTKQISPKLIAIYQAQQQWRAAADELMKSHDEELNAKEKAKSLFLAAQYYAEAGESEKAVAQYRLYAHSYPLPQGLNMEAMYELTRLYNHKNEVSKRDFWLKRMVKSDLLLGAERTGRSRYLAASALSVMADDSYQRFKSIPLSLPLKKSLAKKKVALKSVVKKYTEINDYGVAEFSTLASYRLAEVYGQLSRDLLASHRPKNLNVMAMEQYDILLEEQAYPFEEKAIAIHEQNIRRSWQGMYDQWVSKSFAALADLLPVRYGKNENEPLYSADIY